LPRAKTQPLPFIFWVYWSSVVLAVSAEFCMIFWSADFMENSLGMQKASAAQAVSLFLGGMIVGRLASSRLAAVLCQPGDRRFLEWRPGILAVLDGRQHLLGAIVPHWPGVAGYTR
jgi:hypothetical protein